MIEIIKKIEEEEENQNLENIQLRKGQPLSSTTIFYSI